MYDVVIIGKGLAGATAALLAKEQGLNVAVASRGYGATAMSVGAFDIAYQPSVGDGHEQEIVRAHLEAIAETRGGHPYGVMNFEEIEPALENAQKVLSGALAASSHPIAWAKMGEANRALPSQQGVLWPSGGASTNHWLSWSQLSTKKVCIAAIDGDPSFAPERALAGWNDDAARWGLPTLEAEFCVLPNPARGVTTSTMSIAALLEDEAAFSAWLSELDGVATNADVLMIPPILGLKSHAARREALKEKLGCTVFETLGRIPSVPGFRLQAALDDALNAAGIESLSEVTGFDAKDGRIESLRIGGEKVMSKSVILASGRFISGGVAWGESGPPRETIFSLPLFGQLGWLEHSSPHPVVRREPEESHPLFTAGLGIDSKMRPLAEGRSAFTNLFACGMVLGGFASRYALCADGVALATAMIALRGVVEDVEESRAA